MSDIYEGQRSFGLVLRLNKDYTETIDGIRSALIDTYNGKKVPIEQVADIVFFNEHNTKEKHSNMISLRSIKPGKPYRAKEVI